jgi:hypothetical protein
MLRAPWSNPEPWFRRAVMAMCVMVIALLWVNSRITILWRNQVGAKPVVLSGYYAFHGMAMALREGRIGQLDMAALRRYLALGDPLAVYQRSPNDAVHDWVNYYTLDPGYLVIVEVARLAFPALPDNMLRALALQLFVDAGVVLLVFLVFSQWSTPTGVLASLLYVTNAVFAVLVSFAYYYYWDIPLTFVILGSLLLATRYPANARQWLVVAAVTLGFGVWLRGSWWPLAAFFFLVAASSCDLRRKLLLPIAVFAAVASPQVIRSTAARGELTLSTRAVWHVAMVGLGYYPNKYGLEPKDEAVFKLTREKYGITFRSEDYYVHDQAAKKEFVAIFTNDTRFVISSFLGRLKESVLGSTQTSVLSYLLVSNIAYRLMCLIGLAAMIAHGGDMRLMGFAAAGLYTIYVTLTCLFYFVGLAYDNVSEVSMLVCLLGGLECTRRWIASAGERRRLGSNDGCDGVALNSPFATTRRPAAGGLDA